MLMRPHDGAVDHRIFIVGILRQSLENTLPDALAARAHMACVNDAEIAEPLRQSSPGEPRPIAVEHRINKQTIVLGRHADIASLARKKAFDPVPFIITKGIRTHLALIPLTQRTQYESFKQKKILFDHRP